MPGKKAQGTETEALTASVLRQGGMHHAGKSKPGAAQRLLTTLPSTRVTTSYARRVAGCIHQCYRRFNGKWGRASTLRAHLPT